MIFSDTDRYRYRPICYFKDQWFALIADRLSLIGREVVILQCFNDVQTSE